MNTCCKNGLNISLKHFMNCRIILHMKYCYGISLILRFTLMHNSSEIGMGCHSLMDGIHSFLMEHKIMVYLIFDGFLN